MKRQKFLHSVIGNILGRANYFLNYSVITNNNNGTFTLSGICNFHHIQNGDIVTIATKKYTVQDYDDAAGTLIVSGADVITAKSFQLAKPFFCHGTPQDTQAEVSTIESVIAKTPMIYLMEPYETVSDHDPLSSIDRTCTATFCFLTEADFEKWQTDDAYHNALQPMNNLMEDFIQLLIESNLFSTVEMKTRPKHFPKFGIRVIGEGVKQILFAEKLAGISCEMELEIYQEDSCTCPSGLFLQADNDSFLQVD